MEENKEILIKILTGIEKLDNQLKIIDKRLSLIEQRLTNIAPWISVNNDELRYDPSKHTVVA